MIYYSTHGQSQPATLEQALLDGLAPDEGLYYPKQFPRIGAGELDDLQQRVQRAADSGDPAEQQRALQAVGFHVLERWFGDEVEAHALREIATGAQSFPIPVRRVGELYLLELFHGPTMAFKDVAARHLAQLMGYFLTRRGEQSILLVATSGDTGGAIAHGFAGQDAIQVVVLYPKGKVSHLQEEQLTRVAGNVTPVEVEGVFDDCQRLVKQAFAYPALRHLNLTSANSINIARLIPQSIYYTYAYLTLGRSDLEVVVPSGNFGNLTAALYARETGVPLARFIAATNRNDAAVRYYESGTYAPHPTVQTLSTAMDVGNPSNFVRILELFDHQHERFRRTLRAFRLDDEETVRTIKRVYEEHDYLLCPHTAVGWAVAEKHGDPSLQPLVAATASPAKFAAEIEAATGIPIDDSAEIERLRAYPRRKVTIPNRLEALESLLLELPQDSTGR